MSSPAHRSDPAGRSAVDLVGLSPERFAEFMRTFETSFGRFTSDASLEHAWRTMEPDRAILGQLADGQVVATACNYTFGMSLPHGGHAGCAGIARVGVRADHQRKGVLTRMMRWCMEDAQRHDEPIVALWASESPIYGRFGFGSAVPTVEIEVERRHAALHLDGPVDEVQLVDRGTALAQFPAIYDRMRTQRGGMLGRTRPWWERVLEPLPPPAGREGTTWIHAVLPDRGYAIYRLNAHWDEGVPRGTVEVADLVGLTPAAVAALWQFVIDTDLSERTRVVRRPVDDPLLWMLRDRQRARVARGWSLEVRLVDLVAAIESRGWAEDGRCVIDLDDPFLPTNAGRWRIEVEGGRARCEPAGDAVADVALDPSVLATLYLGGARASQLLAAGRLQATAAAAGHLDRLFATDLAPWQSWRF